MNIHTRRRKKKSAKSGYVYEYYFFFDGMRYSSSGFSSHKAANEAGREYYKKLTLGTEVQKIYRCQMTFNEVAEEYFKVGASKLADNTRRTYQYRLETVKDYIGNKMIWKLDYKTLQVLFNKLGEINKASCNYVTRSAIDAVFRYAVKVDYINKNPVPLVEVSGFKSKDEQKPISKENFLKLYDSFLNDPRIHYQGFAVAMAIGYYTGLRKAEVYGLLKENVDFKDRMIYVRTQLKYTSRNKKDFVLTDELKSEAAEGVVPIPEPLLVILKNWFKVMPESDLVICDQNGGFMSPRYWEILSKERAEKMGFEFHFHSLRHSYATNLVMSGVNIKIAQKLLRHASPTTTLKVYTHAEQRDLLNAVNSVF